jgi:hypothetical protein
MHVRPLLFVLFAIVVMQTVNMIAVWGMHLQLMITVTAICLIVVSCFDMFLHRHDHALMELRGRRLDESPLTSWGEERVSRFDMMVRVKVWPPSWGSTVDRECHRAPHVKSVWCHRCVIEEAKVWSTLHPSNSDAHGHNRCNCSGWW